METGKDRIEELRTFYGKRPPQLRVEAGQQPWLENTVAVWEMRLNHCRTVEPDDFIVNPSDRYAYKQFGNSVSVPVIEAVFEDFLRGNMQQLGWLEQKAQKRIV